MGELHTSLPYRHFVGNSSLADLILRLRNEFVDRVTPVKFGGIHQVKKALFAGGIAVVPLYSCHYSAKANLDVGAEYLSPYRE
ncbi:hypothetical protein AAVH_20558 [Aphelenchoides avenae]|nr:hypothetical protein AAVH_20558 [Aphelenchus avenae]